MGLWISKRKQAKTGGKKGQDPKAGGEKGQDSKAGGCALPSPDAAVDSSEIGGSASATQCMQGPQLDIAATPPPRGRVAAKSAPRPVRQPVRQIEPHAEGSTKLEMQVPAYMPHEALPQILPHAGRAKRGKYSYTVHGHRTVRGSKAAVEVLLRHQAFRVSKAHDGSKVVPCNIPWHGEAGIQEAWATAKRQMKWV